jgi:hypothetical protein
MRALMSYESPRLVLVLSWRLCVVSVLDVELSLLLLFPTSMLLVAASVVVVACDTEMRTSDDVASIAYDFWLHPMRVSTIKCTC